MKERARKPDSAPDYNQEGVLSLIGAIIKDCFKKAKEDGREEEPFPRDECTQCIVVAWGYRSVCEYAIKILKEGGKRRDKETVNS
ncbi:MAG: hypothetical protein QMD08_08000 [Actinomycetota bacterium]|nr:hypothetical protein [Actinomycetota bacterium]